MAKVLLIIRHAKSDWSFQVSDFDRPLNERGFADAPVMARRLLTSSPDRIPQLLISSPAKRAITTAQIFAETLQYPTRNIQISPSIYEASVQELMRIINGLDDAIDRVALFGHNPGLSRLVDYLTDQRDTTHLPTCGIASLQFDAENWLEISGATGVLTSVDYPKDSQD